MCYCSGILLCSKGSRRGEDDAENLELCACLGIANQKQAFNVGVAPGLAIFLVIDILLITAVVSSVIY